jgi:hypothetical protein
MGLVVVTVASGGLPVVETPGGYPVAEGQMGVPVTKVTGKYGWPVTYTGGSGPPNWSSTIFPGSLQITGQTIADSYDIHAYLETITPNVTPIGGATVTDIYAPASGGGTTTVTAPNGMSWTFPGTVTNGTYVNGDVWVYTTSTLPMPTMSSPPTGSGATARNGGMINPTFNTLVETSPMGEAYTASLKQGYDGRSSESGALDYDAASNAHVSAATLSPGDSLVSAVSISDAEYAVFTSNHRAIGQMACLTVVNYIPNTDEFRPPYFGATKTRWRWSDLNLALLPNRTAAFNPKGTSSDDFHIDTASIRADPGVEDPYITNTQAMRCNALPDLQYFIYPIIGTNVVTLMVPYKQQHGYPRDRGAAYGQLACYVAHNFADRDVFLARIVQTGIDAYAVATGFGGNTPFACGAGFFATPLWYIRFAGLLLNNTGMKNAVNISTGKVDFYGNPYPKWGERIISYYSASAYSGYLLPPGYSGSTPLYGAQPLQDVSVSQPANGTYRDPSGVYDTYPYHEASSLWYGTVGANSANATTLQLDAGVPGAWGDGFFNGCTIEATLDGSVQVRTITGYVASTRTVTVGSAFSVNPDNDDTFIIHQLAFPNILASTYAQYPQPHPPGWLGSYAIMNFAHIGSFMASVAMADEAFWGGAVAAYDRRWANDRQMWENWGVQFDYSSTGSGFDYQRDIKGFGGKGNGWMRGLWDVLNPPTETITAGSLPIVGQTITPVWGSGPSYTTIFQVTPNANDPGYPGYALRSTVVVTGGSGGTNKVRVTFEADSTQPMSIDHASIGISVATDPGDSSRANCTATPVELTFNGGGHGFAISAGQTKVSDDVTLGSFTSSNLLNVTIDFGASNPNPRKTGGLTGQGIVSFQAATAWYATASVSPTGNLSAQVLGFNKIEVS